MAHKRKRFQRFQIPSRKLMRYAFKPKAPNPLRRTPEYKAFQKEMIAASTGCAKIGCNKPATDIHHIKRISEYPDLVLDPNNIICVCAECHNQIESCVNRGVDEEIWKHLFEGL